MGNEVSRPAGLSPQASGAVLPPSSPYTPTGASGRSQSFSTRSPSPQSRPPTPPSRRTSSSGSLPSPANLTNPRKERTIQRMDRAIRRRVRGGVTYNMKLLLRGAKGTGKTSLFQRLQGEPIPETHLSTPQLQSATINWSFRANLEENVKCEVWDVVDRGFVTQVGTEDHAAAVSAEPVEQGGLQSGGSLSAEAAAAAAAAAATVSSMPNGTHSVAIVDASTVDVYHEAHGVIFLLDVTKWDTLEYVKQQLDNVPVHIPTLVLGNFRDQGAQRKIFKEDIQELLYGSTDRPQHPQWRRPVELLYFECSLLNCYGLKSLHQYFGIPFLQLKLATIRQQMRIVEGEFAHLKNDLQANISEQRYADYVEHIRATGSDIRTGKRAAGGAHPAATPKRNGSVRVEEATRPTKPAVQGESTKQSVSASDDDESIVVSNENRDEVPPEVSRSESATVNAIPEPMKEEQKHDQGFDTEDLPARSTFADSKGAIPLKFEHQESSTSITGEVAEDSSTVNAESKTVASEEKSSDIPVAVANDSSRPRKASIDEVIHLEDFQVPKTRAGMNDLDHFYSEDESDDDGGEYDEDVVVAPANGGMKGPASGVSHKQRFLDSDSSDAEDAEILATRRVRKGKTMHKNSPRKVITKQVSRSEQPAPKMTQPSPPSQPPLSSSVPNQIPGTERSPTQSQPSSPVKDSRSEVSPQQGHSTKLSNDVAVSVDITPPVAPIKSPTHHDSSPKLNSNNSSPMSRQETPVQTTCVEEEHGRNSPSTADEDKSTGNTNMSNGIEEQESKWHLNEEIKQPTELRSDNENTELPTDRIDLTNESTSMELKENPRSGNDASCESVDFAQTESGASYGIDPSDRDSEVGSHPFTDKPSNTGTDFSANTGSSDTVVSSFNVALDVKQMDTFLDEDDEDDSVPAPEESPLSETLPSPPLKVASPATQLQGAHIDNDARNAPASTSDLLSLSSLQASLPIPGQVPATLSQREGSHNEMGSDETASKGLHLSDLQEPVPALPVFSERNDLEAFLNESDSDSDAAPPGDAAPDNMANQTTKRCNGGRAMVASSEDEDDDRFANYSISKKSRSERRRQQKEDLRQLNAALDKTTAWEESGAGLPHSSSGLSVSDSSFGSTDVMEAIRKAQEEAMRMLPSTSAPVDDTDSSLKKRHKHKHKKSHKKTDDSKKEKSSKRGGHKSGSRSKKRPSIVDDVA